MDFEYTTSFYVELSEFNEMVEQVKNGKDINHVFNNWANGLDDCDYYAVDFVKEKIITEILKRI